MIAFLAAALMAPPSGVLVVDMLTIGRVTKGKWAKVENRNDPVGQLKDALFLELDFVTLGKSLTVPKLEFQDEVAPGWFVTDRKAESLVLWSGSEPLTPNIVPYSTTAKTYLDVVQAFLKSKKLTKAKARINKVFAVDLDGDGIREVLIDASSRKDMVGVTMEDGKPTDYSTILLRYVRNGKTLTKVVAHSDGHSGVLETANQIRAIADLNGDGLMELVYSSNYYEGTNATVVQFKKGNLTKLVENGAGV